MRPHLIIRLAHVPPAAAHLPHWEDAIADSAGARRPITPEVESLLADREIEALFTAEVTLVSMTLDGQPTRLPQELRRKVH